jgi:hypothetical protein
MNRKLLALAAGFFSLTLLGGPAVVQASSAPSHTRHRGDNGLTRQGIATAQASGVPSSLVAMRPQSSVALLEHKAKELGPHEASDTLRLTVGLKLRHVAELKHFLQAVQNPASPQYHQFLTPQEFTARFGPGKAQVARLEDFLKARGITVENVSPDRMLIHTKATTAVYAHAFGIQINDYTLDGRRFYSTIESPKLPREIAAQVQNIMGLNHGVLMRPLHQVEFMEQGKDAITYAAPPTTTLAYNPHQVATAYEWPDITDTKNGAGVTIAILTAASSGLASNSSYRTFWHDYGLPDHTVKVIPIHGDVGDTRGMTETLLDMELSGAMAPGAKLDVYVISNAYLQSFTDMYDRFTTDNKAQVMTTSWGSNEDQAPALDKTNEQIFMKAAAQGISMFAASGDSGSGSGSGQDNMATYPSSSVYITAANGTVLKIKKDGTYISESAWSDTGGAISALFDQPDWQHGPGVPDSGHRMNSDLSLNGGTENPYYILVNGQWGGVAGTSAVSPQLAALFAIAVSRQANDKRLGLSNQLIYDDVNAGYLGTDFRDVTTGCNGAYCAGKDWDHPTGWGSPRAKSLISHLGAHGPAGTLEGTVSDAASGAPIAGATVTVSPGGRHEETSDNGGYSFLLPVGDYTATVNAFGYEEGKASVSIAKDTKTTQDFSLTAMPMAKLSGKVSDGSGHGYGLYAEVKVSTAGFGQVADAWTDPKTGAYSISLPKGEKYTLKVISALDGYQSASTEVTLAGNQTQNFALNVASVCTAPGYAFTNSGFGEDFNGSFPPAGWKVTNAVSGSSVVWKTNKGWGDDNWTGGSGHAADSDSGKAGPAYRGPHDTSLVSPPISVTALAANPVLKYKANFQSFQGNDALDLQISANGGAWQTIKHWQENHGANEGLPGEKVQVELGQYMPATGSIRLRWRNFDLGTTGWDYYAQVDDVSIGACSPVSGGLVYGQVKDATTDKGIVGASVSSDSGESTQTLANLADSNFPAGGYLLFVASGTHTLKATARNYSTASASVEIADDAVTTQNFALKSGRLSASPDAISLHVGVGEQVHKKVTVKNIGSGAVHFLLLPINVPPSVTSGAPEATAALLQAAKGRFSPASMAYIQAHGGAPSVAGGMAGAMTSGLGAWIPVANYPIPIEDNAAARDPATGKVYSVGGYDASANVNTNVGFMYDPKVDGWYFIAYMAKGRASPAAAFINGRLYVTNGWGSFGGNPVARLGIYNPETDTWSKGAKNPVPAGGGSTGAVLDGKMYVVGGCKNSSCDPNLSAVEVYDPNTGKWSAAANYPHAVSFVSCGAIAGRLYCAGGTRAGAGDQYQDGYGYNPETNEWTPIKDMPIGLWGSGFAAANGLLLVSGGITNNNSAISAQSFAYDPFSNKWRPLPDSNNLVYRGGSACGLYKFGGSDAHGGFLAASELLQGYAPCQEPPSIPWLTVTPSSSTLAAAASTTLNLTIDGSGQKPFTTSKAYLEIAGYTPYDTTTVPLTITWDAEPASLVLSGSAGQDTVPKGGSLVYTLKVENQKADGHGAATDTILTYPLPDGVDYVSSGGDANCTAPGADSSAAPAAASAESGRVSCDFGTLAPGASKTGTIAVQANKAGELTSTFSVSSREPNDSGKDTLSIKTKVTSGSGPGPGPGPNPGGGGGGGSLGWLAIAALLGLALAGTRIRRRRV